MEQELPGGLLLRPATAADADAIVKLDVEAFGASEEAGVRSMLTDPAIGPERFTVVTDGPRIVSTMGLMAVQLRLGGVELQAGQVEYVATDGAYRRRGLVRRQIEVLHGWSQERGDLLTLIEGIPYFYRRFGYEYAVRLPSLHVPAWPEPELPGGYTVRTATAEDLPALRALLARTHAAADLVRLPSDHDWALLLDEPGHELLLAVADGQVRGFGQRGSVGTRVTLRHVGVDTLEAGLALLAHLLLRGDGARLWMADRPGTTWSALLQGYAAPVRRHEYGLYARVPDPPALLRRLRPVLSARLAASEFARERGRLLLSFYTSAVELRYADGAVTAIEAADAVEDPGEESDDEVGVPPDLVATLLLGRHGAAELAARYDDVRLLRRTRLMEVLFPRLVVDLA